MSSPFPDSRALSDRRIGPDQRPQGKRSGGRRGRPAYSKKRADDVKIRSGREDGDRGEAARELPRGAGRTAERQGFAAPGGRPGGDPGQEPGSEPGFRSAARPETAPASAPEAAKPPVLRDQALSSPQAADEDAPLLCGLKPVLELLEREPGQVDALWLRRGRRTPETARILDLCRAADIRFTLCDGPALDRLCGARHQGVIARLFETGFADFAGLLVSGADAPLPLLLALDQVQDPGNAGTLARTLHALGGAGLVIPRHNGVYLGAGARRSAAGALEQLPVAKVMNLARALDEARRAGWRVYGAAAGGSGGKTSINAFAAPLRLPAVLVLGSEEKGLRPLVAARCDELVTVPMLRPFDSLNVAQAGGILIACFARGLPAFAAD